MPHTIKYHEGVNDLQVLLWQVRTAKNLTLEQTEKLTGVPRSTLSRIENGQVSPRLATLEAIAKGLDVHIQDLYQSKYK